MNDLIFGFIIGIITSIAVIAFVVFKSFVGG